MHVILIFFFTSFSPKIMFMIFHMMGQSEQYEE